MVAKKRVISFLLVFSMVTSLSSSYAFAVEERANEARVQEIIEELLIASSQKEIDALLTEYHKITDRARAASAWLIAAPNGGTLDLEYTGTPSPTKVIFTRVVYMPVDQVNAYGTLMSNTNALEIIKGILIDTAVTTMTTSFVSMLEIKSKLVAGALTGFVGVSTAFVMAIFNQMEKLNFYDALERSSTGKLKLEFYYVASIDHCDWFTHFEPWESNFAEVPENYSRTWHDGEFIYG